MRKHQSGGRDGRKKNYRAHPRHAAAPPGPKGGALPIYGIHAVAAALANPNRRIDTLFATENALQRLGDAIRARGIEAHKQSPDDIARRLPEGAVHQGALMLAAPLPEPALESLAGARLVLLLDQVTDPHNIGAIFRSAAAFGAGAVITQARGAPEPAGALAKAASGGLEHVPYLRVANLSRAMDALKEAGFWIVGLDGGADGMLEEALGDAHTGLVLGAEGRGLRRLTRERCDRLARIPLPGPIGSLNVSNASAIALYALTRADKSATGP